MFILYDVRWAFIYELTVYESVPVKWICPCCQSGPLGSDSVQTSVSAPPLVVYMDRLPRCIPYIWNQNPIQ